jgi:hypothetical protein
MVQMETAKALAQRYLGPTVFVLLVLLGSVAGGMAWVWSQNEKVIERGKQLAAEQQAFNKEKLTSEIALSKRETDLDKREFIVQQREKDYDERLSSFQKRVAEYDTAAAKLKQEQAEVSEAQRIKDAQGKIERLMSEFSALGVNLSRPACNEEARIKYNAAQAKYSEIYTLSNAYGLKGRYDHFLKSNRGMIKSTCPWLLATPHVVGSPFDDAKDQR